MTTPMTRNLSGLRLEKSCSRFFEFCTPNIAASTLNAACDHVGSRGTVTACSGAAGEIDRGFSLATDSERCRACLCDGLILLARTAADADGADHVAVLLQRNAAGENHDAAVIGTVNAEELLARLRVVR